MRILHTSDWHLGRLFHRASLLDEQRAAMERIVELVNEADVDLVVVAGDLYDRSIPPADAVELFDSTLVELHGAGAAVVAISGNHDSAVRVGYADRLLADVGVTVRGDASRAAEAVLVPVDGAEPLVVYPVPYLDPLATAHLAGVGPSTRTGPEAEPPPDPGGGGGLPVPRSAFTHHDAMNWAMQRARADLARRRVQHPGVRSLVVAHTFLTGGNPSESERELTLGHVEQVRLDVFDGFDYVALGHLHQSQAFDGGRVAYSGTPLPYSFSEQHHTKSVRIVDLGSDGSLQVDVVPLGVGRPLRTITGELESLLSGPALTDAEDAWVRVRLTDPRLPLQAMRRLQQRFPHAVELSHEPPGQGDDAAVARTSAEVRRAEPLDLATEFLGERRGVPADEHERQLLASAIARVTRSAT